MYHDQWHGCYRIGHPGNLIPLPDPVGLKISRTDLTVINRSATGQARALQVVDREPRTWAVSWPYVLPELIAPLMELRSSPVLRPPYVWVTPWAVATNLLTPEDSMLRALDSLVATGFASPVGAYPLAEGGTTAVCMQLTEAAQAFSTSLGRAPVASDRPVTVTVRVASYGGARVTATLLDANGDTISQVRSSAVDGLDVLRPATVTIADVDSAAVEVQVSVTGASVIARPQVTWSDRLLPWGIGEGCTRATVIGLDQEILSAAVTVPTLRRSGLSFTVVELG